MTKASRQLKNRESPIIVMRDNREAERGFSLRSLKRASCFGRKRFSATSAVREQSSKRRIVSKAILWKDL